MIPLMIGLNIFVGILRSNYIYEVLKIRPDITSTIVFILLSNVLFAVGIIISILHHDRSQELVVAFNSHNKAKKEYQEKIKPLIEEEQNQQKKYSELVKGIEYEFEQEKVKIEKIIPNLNNEIKETVDKHDRILNTFKALEKEVDSNYKVCIANYRSENHRNRKNTRRPRSWKEIPQLTFVFHKKEELDPNKEITSS